MLIIIIIALVVLIIIALRISSKVEEIRYNSSGQDDLYHQGEDTQEILKSILNSRTDSTNSEGIENKLNEVIVSLGAVAENLRLQTEEMTLHREQQQKLDREQKEGKIRELKKSLEALEQQMKNTESLEDKNLLEIQWDQIEEEINEIHDSLEDKED